MTNRFSLLSKIVFNGNNVLHGVLLFTLRVLTTIKNACGTLAFQDY